MIRARVLSIILILVFALNNYIPAFCYTTIGDIEDDGYYSTQNNIAIVIPPAPSSGYDILQSTSSQSYEKPVGGNTKNYVNNSYTTGSTYSSVSSSTSKGLNSSSSTTSNTTETSDDGSLLGSVVGFLGVTLIAGVLTVGSWLLENDDDEDNYKDKKRKHRKERQDRKHRAYRNW